MTIADATPQWPAEWTAVGTVALAIVTVAAIITTILITKQDRSDRRGGIRPGRGPIRTTLNAGQESTDQKAPSKRTARIRGLLPGSTAAWPGVSRSDTLQRR